MHLRTFRDGDQLVERLTARPQERVRELGSGLDVHEFAAGTRVLETGDLELLRVTDYRIGALQDRGVQALATALGRSQLELPRGVELHTRMNGTELQEVVRAGEGTEVTLEMELGTLEPDTFSYALIMADGRRALVRTLPKGLITRLWVDGLRLRRDQWGIKGNGHDTDPRRGYIDLMADGPLVFRHASPRPAGRPSVPPATTPRPPAFPSGLPGEHHAAA